MVMLLSPRLSDRDMGRGVNTRHSRLGTGQCKPAGVAEAPVFILTLTLDCGAERVMHRMRERKA